jgi:CRISPR-associated protein Cmr2
VSKVFWQAKIWGLLHDPIFKSLDDNSDSGKHSRWQQLAVMQDWVDRGLNPAASGGKAIEQMKLANLITAASDRGAIGSLSVSSEYAGTDDRNFGLTISHLLSGAKTEFKLQPQQHQQLISGSRQQILSDLETDLFNLQLKDRDGNWRSISELDDPQKLFWWLWRCLPTAAGNLMGNDESLLLMPAQTRIPDGSIWNHASLTAAMAGALTGFDVTLDDLQQSTSEREPSRADLATFSFTPIQELIKASRKMRDFWAGSWLLHYLSAKVSWQLALKYGPDSLVYPSLFQQPLIDSWILAKWPDFATWIDRPSERQLLTAGFPNVIVMLLPEGKVDAAMQYAKQILEEEWLKIGDLVYGELQHQRHWMPGLVKQHITWNGWLQTQWQTYWSAMPIGDRTQALTSNEIHQHTEKSPWRDAQNETFQVNKDHQLFKQKEAAFINQAANFRPEKAGEQPFQANVGSWWPYIFDRTRANVTAVKNARTWQLPTAFDTRSTISGLGSIVHHYPVKHQVTDTEAKALWQHQAGLFDGREQLNASEVVKRALHLVIPRLIPGLTDTEKIAATYPDLTAGVAGYLRTQPAHQHHFQLACKAVEQELRTQTLEAKNLPKNCGIPWIESQATLATKTYHPRHLSPAWLVEEIETGDEQRQEVKANLDRVVSEYYPGNNPADWYVLAAGDGDGMSEWLKGSKLKPYRDYVPEQLIEKVSGLQARGLSEAEARTPRSIESDSLLFTTFNQFLDEKKRMGPSTHAALSRALLDFSNQLVPYLTEQRYAGRLVYSGGDDVLAYTNLWEWDRWLWDVRECFRGKPDPAQEFRNDGDYWQWKTGQIPENLSKRPLFTMGGGATISFGIVIADRGVPLAIALENMWEAEQGAKDHFCATLAPTERQKNAVQVRVLYGNGNILKATAKFEAFKMWQALLDLNLEPALFEQAAQIWEQHPVPGDTAILAWTKAFSDRRDVFKSDRCLSRAEDKHLDSKQEFIITLSTWLTEMWKTNSKSTRDAEIVYWLKLAAFVLRKREIKLGGDC